MDMTPLYDIKKTYLENAEEGPFFEGTIPPRKWPDKKEWKDFLGYPIASPIGIPAGPLLNGKWIELAAQLGYDVLTYKTIRSHEHPSHPLPNIVPVQTSQPLIPGNLPDFVHQTPEFTTLNNDQIGITNSFGNPSRTPEYLAEDIRMTNQRLAEGQVMIVSVFGSERPGVDTFDDFVDTALFAKECGAHILEANYSCPNVSASEGSLYSNPDAVFTLSSKLVKAIGDTPLIIKVGLFPNPECMREVFLAAARAGVRAICGINTISMQVVNDSGEPALGPDRKKCGVCGGPIRYAALEFTQRARDLIDKERLDMTLITTGGATQPEHFQDFLNAGADIAMTATGMMWDPYLATKYHKHHEEVSYV